MERDIIDDIEYNMIKKPPDPGGIHNSDAMRDADTDADARANINMELSDDGSLRKRKNSVDSLEEVNEKSRPRLEALNGNIENTSLRPQEGSLALSVIQRYGTKSPQEDFNEEDFEATTSPQENLNMDRDQYYDQQQDPSDQTAEGEEVGHANNGPKVSDLIIMDLIGKTKDANLIRDTDTIKFMLKNSLFGPKYSGRPIFNYNSHSMKLFINNKNDADELMKVTQLYNEEGMWPVSCRLPVEAAEVRKEGVLKNVHPQINTERIKASLIRNGEPILNVSRIENKSGPTYCVKITFSNYIPDQVWYDGQYRMIHKYRPPFRTMMCNHCSYAGQRAQGRRVQFKG